MRESLLQIGQGYASARQEPFGDHPLSKFIREQLKNDVEEALGNLTSTFIVDASPGKGNWATIPWVAVFNPAVTDSATKGYYIVYLFAPDKAEIHLSLNQGTTVISDEFGARGLEVLKKGADTMRRRVSDFTPYFDIYDLDLGSKNRLPKGYEAGHAFGRTYRLGFLPTEEALRDDLKQMVKAYLALTDRGGLDSLLGTVNINQEDSTDTDDEDKPIDMTVTEERQYRTHRRIDRDPTASRKAKQYHGTKCQACCFDFVDKYGDLGAGFVEAHHLKPLSTLEEGVKVKYDVATDFVVLCSNCHRMIHRMPNPADMDSFRKIIRQGC